MTGAGPGGRTGGSKSDVGGRLVFGLKMGVENLTGAGSPLFLG